MISTPLIIVIIGIFGLIVGSFLNVVVLRMNTGKRLDGRSKCLSCNKTLRWYHMIPVISFLIQGGKCAFCKSRISVQYPIVEFLTAILFAGAAFAFPEARNLVPWLIIISCGIIISVYDSYHHIIPKYPLIIIAIAGLLLYPSLLGFLIVPLFFLIVWVLSKGRLIGFGDIEIMAVIGLILGILGGFSALLIAFWIATLVVIIGALLSKKTLMQLRKKRIAFGPFLFLGMYIVGVLGFNIVGYFVNMIY